MENNTALESLLIFEASTPMGLVSFLQSSLGGANDLTPESGRRVKENLVNSNQVRRPSV